MVNAHVEKAATSRLGILLSYCSQLDAFIASGDKVPLIDGHIEVYSRPGRKNEDRLGRVDIQVKGVSAKPSGKPLRTYQITRTELVAYQRSRGVLYFVVTIDEKRARETPYYVILTPFKIAEVLSRVPESQKTIAVPLTPLVEDPKKIQRIVGLALKMQEQSTSIAFEPSLFETATSFTVHTADGLDLDKPMRLSPLETDHHLELHTAAGSTIPLNGVFEVIPHEYTDQFMDARVCSGHVVYDHALVRRLDEESVKITLSKSLSLVLKQSNGQQTINATVSLAANFAERLKEVEFFLGVLDHRELTIGRDSSELGQILSHSSSDVSRLREHFDFLRRLQELFDHLQVDSSRVNMDDLSDEQINALLTLRHAVTDGEDIMNEGGEISLTLVGIGRWAVLIMMAPGSSPGEWRYANPFSPYARQFLRGSEGGGGRDDIPVTAYDAVDREHLPLLLNLRLDSIVAAYEAIKDSDRTLLLANRRVLALIMAADDCPERENEFLSAAEALNEWLIEEEGAVPRNLVNRWQIQLRAGTLTRLQRAEIRDLKRQAAQGTESDATEVELACAILLGDTEEAEYLEPQVPELRLQEMRSWPLWELRK